MNRYNVLWIDDEWQKQSMFINLCRKKHNINVVPFEFVPDGLEELEKNLSSWDAVILDAKVKMSKADTPNLEGLQVAVKKIEKLSEKHPLPYFISTGQPDLMDADFFKQIYGRFYVKVTEDDRLMQDIVNGIEEFATPEFLLRNKFPKEFEAAKLIPNAENLLIQGLLSEVSDSPDNDAVIDSFNPIRMLFENILDQCQVQGYIPYLNSLNSVCDFFSFKEVDGFKLTKPIMHKTLIHSLDYFLSITQDGSHDKSDLELEVIEYVRNRNNHNLFRSMLYIAMDLLLWYKELCDDYPNSEGLWSGTYEEQGPVNVIMNGERRAYVIGNKYQLEDNGELREGNEVVIIKSHPNKHPFGEIDRFVFKANYKIRK